jgi:hypothetical protein
VCVHAVLTLPTFPDVRDEVYPGGGADRVVVGWMLLGFLVAFVVTRLVTHAIRAGRGPFRDTSVGGLHIHHEVYGIFLLLISGTAQFTYLPQPPVREVLAVLFGVGAALTLDEFALWLHLRDVYWSQAGRQSVDAVLVAAVVGTLLFLGANPFGERSGVGELTAAITVLVNLCCAVVAILKGRTALGVIGVVVPFVALVTSLRLARPTSFWARRRYPPGSERLERARRRFPPGARSRWDPVVDLLAGRPTPPPAAAGPGGSAGPPTAGERGRPPALP